MKNKDSEDIKKISSVEVLVSTIRETNRYFLNQVQKQVNIALTFRNWIIGLYIVEYEQNGEDKAKYGEGLMKEVAKRLKGVKGISVPQLYRFKDFYLAYPQIFSTLSRKLQDADFKGNAIIKRLPETTVPPQASDARKAPDVPRIDPELLVTRLSFSHILELLSMDTPLKRTFYEVEAIKNNWSVRELKRAINSMLYERTGLSTDKKAVLEKQARGEDLKPGDVFRDPYILEFLGLEEKPEYTETDLEQAIISHLQQFLLEMGRGFCFEARQKRITFDNIHYRIDLVFYHRILKCHVLVDLKLGEFTHADAGQMNVYLNYYKENEKSKDDHDPVGIILCAGKNENLVKYATGGLPQQVFVNKYMINLPKEEELKKIIQEEQEKLRTDIRVR